MFFVGCTEQSQSELMNEEPIFPEEEKNEWIQDGEEGCPDSWLLTYAIQGEVDITDTPLNIGNAHAFIGGIESDEMVIRIADRGGVPSEGQFVLTSFHLLQDFTVSVNMLGDIAINTYLSSTSSDECGLATGQFYDSSMVWDDCSYGEEHGTNNWSPDEGAFGSGCIRDYHVEGLVECIDDSFLASCTDGWLDEGDNYLDYTYSQPMLNLEFDTPNLERFTMKGSEYGVELPTYTNNRTWLILEGTLKSMRLEKTPDCLCNE